MTDVSDGSPKLFNVEIKYVASRRVTASRLSRRKIRCRVEHGAVRMAVMASDQADARKRAEGWFQRQIAKPELARVLFGTGRRDCDPATVKLDGEIWASESDLPDIAAVEYR